MARTNKYTAINFNDIYEKKATSASNSITDKHRRSNSFSSSSPSSSSSTPLTTPPGNKTILANSRIHGNMLVLSRPSPKPVILPQQPSPPPSPASASAAQIPDQPRVEEDSISLRPLGRTGSCPPLSPLTSPGGQNKNSPVSPKTNKFVPPHLRPGFAGREEKPGSEFQKHSGSGMRSNLGPSPSGSPKYHGEEGRPKSGGGYERMRRGLEVDPVEMNRFRPTGSTRPNSSG